MGVVVMNSRSCCRRAGFLLISYLICLSPLAVSRVSCQLENIRESAGKWMSSFKDTFKENLGPAVKKVAKTASDVIDVAKNTMTEALGPDLNKNKREESCPKEGCPGGEEGTESVPDGDGSRPPSHSSEQRDKEDSKSEVARVSEDSPGLLNMIFGSASTGLATVGRTLYDTLNDLTSRFAETVRQIVSEELYDLMVASMKGVRKAMFTPGATLFYLGETAASIALFLSCLLLSYIFLRIFSFLFVLAFISATFLLHQILGSVTVWEWIFWVIGNFLPIAIFLAEHYYITAILILVLFGYSSVMVVIRWSTQFNERRTSEDVKAILLEQSVKLTNLQNTLDRRLQTIEDNQRDITRLLCELKKPSPRS